MMIIYQVSYKEPKIGPKGGLHIRRGNHGPPPGLDQRHTPPVHANFTHKEPSPSPAKSQNCTHISHVYAITALSISPTSPPAFLTALTAASLSFRRRSRASCSRRARVLELPLGATSDSSLALSAGVKLTKSSCGGAVPAAAEEENGPATGVLKLDGVLGVRGVRCDL